MRVFASTKESMDIAVREVSALTAEPELGKIYQGTVTGTKEFGAFVEFMPGREGLVHISELADFRVKSVEEICKNGDLMWVKCLAVDEMSGKVRLSRKAALADMDQQGGEPQEG